MGPMPEPRRGSTDLNYWADRMDKARHRVTQNRGHNLLACIRVNEMFAEARTKEFDAGARWQPNVPSKKSSTPRESDRPSSNRRPSYPGTSSKLSRDSPFRNQVSELEVEHNQAWEQMVTGEGQIKYDNIAWPEIPTGDGENNKLMRHMLGGSNKLKSLRKRWHPDKLQQTLGKRISPHDATRIFERVNDIFSTYLAEDNNRRASCVF